MLRDCIILGNNKEIIEKCANSFRRLGVSVYTEGAKDADIFCYVYCHTNKEKDSAELEYDEIEKVFSLMKEKQGGRCILVTNYVEDSFLPPNKDRVLARSAAAVKWWKAKTVELGMEGIQSNILNVSYIFNEEDEKAVDDWMVVKRPIREDDIFYGLKTLINSDMNFLVGQTLNLNGGINIHPIKPILPNILASIDTVDSIKDSTMLVIGASSGIGRETAYLLAERGANLVLFARRIERLKEIKKDLEKYKVHVHVEEVDVTDSDRLASAISACYEKCNGIDGLVYASGAFDGENLIGSERKWEKILQTNLEGYMHAVRVYIGCCKENKRKGSIVGISSVAGFQPILPNLEAYSVSKKAVVHFARSMAISCSRYGIRINNIAPGWVDTEMAAGLTVEYQNYWLNRQCIKRPGTPREMAALIRYLISDESSYMTGETIANDGGVLLGKM